MRTPGFLHSLHEPETFFQVLGILDRKLDAVVAMELGRTQSPRYGPCGIRDPVCDGGDAEQGKALLQSNPLQFGSEGKIVES